MFGDPTLEFGQLGLVAAEQVELVLRGADRALDSSQGKAFQEFFEPVVGDQEFVSRGREPLA